MAVMWMSGRIRNMLAQTVEEQLTKINDEKSSLETQKKSIKSALLTTNENANRKKGAIMIFESFKDKARALLPLPPGK